MIRVLIVDDEPPARARLRRLLSGNDDIVVIGECRNGEEAVEAIGLQAPDVVFLDVQMPGMDGFSVLKELDSDRLPAIVFVTAFDKYAVRAFEVHALDYLLKPFDRERFEKTLEHVRSHHRRGIGFDHEKLLALLADLQARDAYETRLPVRDGNKVAFVSVNDIEWIESSGNYVVLHTKGTRHILRETMAAISKRLDPRQFRRIHRQSIVNVRQIRELHSWGQGESDLILASGARVRVSRRFRENLDTAL